MVSSGVDWYEHLCYSTPDGKREGPRRGGGLELQGSPARHHCEGQDRGRHSGQVREGPAHGSRGNLLAGAGEKGVVAEGKVILTLWEYRSLPKQPCTFGRTMTRKSRAPRCWS